MADNHKSASGVRASDDTARLDYLQRTGSTLEILPGTTQGARFRFRVGGLHSAVSDDLRAAIDTASGVAPAALTQQQIEKLARLGCGGDNTRWSFSDAGLRRTIEAALAAGVKTPDGAQR